MSEPASMNMVISAASCRWCGEIRLLILPGLPPPTVAEYFEKVTLHEADCGQRPEGDILG